MSVVSEPGVSMMSNSIVLLPIIILSFDMYCEVVVTGCPFSLKLPFAKRSIREDFPTP